jgi:WD40 repeat protein
MGLLWPPSTKADNPADGRAEAALLKLVDRVKDASGDSEKLRQDVLAFRRVYPGTSYAVRAAHLLTRLPSPLDKLDPATIPALERFDWQPKELVALLGEHKGRQGAPVSAVLFSPDGKTMVSGGGSLVRLWDPATMRQRHLLGNYATICLAMTRDGKLLAAAGAGGNVTVWEMTAEAPKLRYSISASSTPAYSVAFAPSGKTLAVACGDNQLRFYDMTAEKETKLQIAVPAHDKAVAAVAYHPDGKTLASGGHDMTVRLWDVTGDTPKEKAVLTGHTKEVYALAFNPAGTTLASVGADSVLHLWPFPATSKTRPRAAVPVPAGILYAVAFAPSGRALAVACADSSMRILDVAGPAPKERFKLEGHQSSVNGVAYAPDGKLLASGSYDWTARTWDMSAAKPAPRFQPWSHLSHVYSIAFTPDLQTFASGSEDRVLRLWDLTRAEPRTRSFLKGDSVPIYSLTYSPDGKSLAVAGAHTTVRQYESATGKGLRPIVGHPGSVSSVAYGPDGRQLLTSSQKSVFLWDTATGKELRRLDGHETNVNCLSWSPDGKHVLSGSGSYLYKNGQIVVVGGKVQYVDCTMKLWDLDERKELWVLKSQPTPTYSVAFTPDGRRAYSGAYEASARQWELTEATLRETGTIKGGSGYIHSFQFSPDGQTLVTRGLDGLLIQWDLATGKRLHEWTFPETIGNVAFASDGRHLAVALGTGVIYVLRLAPAAKTS